MTDQSVQQELIVCRTCATQKLPEKCLKFGSPEASGRKIIEKITLIGLWYHPEDPLPKYICRTCLKKLDHAVAFIQVSKNAEKRLSKMADTAPNLKPELNAELSILAKQEPVEIMTEPETSFYYDNSPSTSPDDSEDDDQPLVSFATKDKKLRPRKKVKFQEEKKKVRFKPESKRKKKRIEQVMKIKLEPQDEAVLCEVRNTMSKEAILNAKQVWTDYPWECSDCQKNCIDLNALRTHSIESHQRCCTLKCVDCVRFRAPYNNLLEFVSHAVKHRQKLKLCCLLCNQKFNNAQQTEEHYKTHKMACEICGQAFDNDVQLNQHMSDYGFYALNNTRQCPDCLKVFKNGKPFDTHALTHKPRTRDHSCSLCGKAFYNKGALQTHINTHSTELNYECLICHRAYKSALSLNRHMMLHDKTRKVVCEQCGRSFRNKNQLKWHTRVHTNEANYACTYCPKKFKFSSNLKTHLRQHTGERPFSCEMCNHSFTNHGNYYKHMKRRHDITIAKPRIVL